MVSLGVILLAAGLAGGYLVYRARGDAEVMEDIDRHFSSLPQGRLQKRPATGSMRTSKNHLATPLPSEPEPDQSENVRHPNAEKKRSSRKQPPEDRRAVRVLNSAPYTEDIVEIAPSTYIVDAQLVSRAQKNPQRYIGAMRADVAHKNGKAVGFKVSGIRPGSTVFALGLRSGDILKAVNGQPLTSVDQAVVAMATMQMNTKFRLDVQRNNRKLSLYYKVQ